MWGHKYLYWADTRRIKVSTGSSQYPAHWPGAGITGCSISLITFDLASSLISRPQLFIKMTDLLPAPAWQSWHRQYLQSERLSGSRHNYTSISGNQARYGHSEIHCYAARYWELTRHDSHFQFLPFSHFPEYDVFSPCLASIHSPSSLSGLSNKI